MPQLPFRKREPARTSLATTAPLLRRTNRRVRRFQVGLVIGVCVGLLSVALIALGGLNRFEARLADLFYRPRSPSGAIVLIVMDDAAIENYDWPFERFVHSSFLFNLIHAQPKVIALDFILPDPASAQEDETLATILRRTDKIVQSVLGIEATRYPTTVKQFPSFDSILAPALPLRTSNTIFSHAMIYPDPDGVVRRIPLAIDVPGARFPALGLAALALYQDREPQIEIQNDQVFFAGKPVPLDDSGQLLLHYVKRDAIQKIAYADFLQGKADYALLRDKIVLVGPKNKAIHENYAVPLTISDSSASNVELQADLIETLMSGVFLRNQDRAVLMGEALLVALVAGVTLPQLPLLYATALVLAYFVAYLLYAFNRFDNGILATPLYVVLALGLTYVLTMLYRYLSEERGRALVARAFLGIVSPETAHQVLVQYERGALSLSGGRREATVLCVGLRELTGLSDAMAPEMLIELLNRYTARVFETVFRWDGSVNKVGNNIVVVWNLPLDHPDHAHRAVRAAFDILHALEDLHPASPDERPVGVCLGIATGIAIAGRLGVSARADYTVIGEVVTVAERVSILASDNQVLVDPATYDQIRDEFETRDVHTIRVRGRKDPLVIRQVFENAPALTP
ncbi:MAG: adenylate/guanylate cyclase domain-containing protein [Anaerolineales bacterium]|nr:adenylate/guanylate cyclase domain-containing protein [Anaerolineales bacterium]